MSTKQERVARRNAVMLQVIEHLLAQDGERSQRSVIMQQVRGATIDSLGQMERNGYIARSDTDDGAIGYRATHSGMRRVGLGQEELRAVAERHIPTGTYAGDELRPYSDRPGANDAFALPSLIFGRLHYRHGKVRP
jgi:hypothetical protein